MNDAINQGKKVSFQYFQYIKKEQKLRHDGEVYFFSPYTLVGNGDYYYVVGYADKHQNIGSFCVDRIYKQPNILVVVKKQQTANDGDLVIALTNGENNLKHISFDAKNKWIMLSPESGNPHLKPKKYCSVQIQGVVSHIIKEAQ